MQSGYSGRTGVFELLVADDELRRLVHEGTSEAVIRAAALAGGMQLMREDGRRLVAGGITSEQELLRVTRD
jgi:general secretion pathway protein E